MSLVYGDQFILLAHTVLQSRGPRNYYPVLEWDQKNITYFEDILTEWDNPTLLFCINDSDLYLLHQKLHLFKNAFVLLSHNSDENITEKYAFLYEHPKIHHWFVQNVLVQNTKVTNLPIGKANPTWNHGNKLFFQEIQDRNPQKTIPIFACFLLSTNRDEREKCQTILANFGIQNHTVTHPLQYFFNLASSYFCICPQGNGVDTHRFWECLYFKTIPICIRTPFTETLAKEFPCCLLDSWEKLPEQLVPYNASLFTKELAEKLEFPYYRNLILQKVNELLPV